MGAFGTDIRDTLRQGALRKLIPLNSLSDKHFDEISSNLAVSTINAGDYLFRAGDSDKRCVYLLDGAVSFLDTSTRITGRVAAGSETARYPLANRQPRLVSARATSRCVIATIDSTLLDILLTLDQTLEPRTTPVGTDSDQDWMTRMLQSEAFIKISPADIQRLLSQLESITVSAGDVVIKQGDEGDYFYIIREGTCSVTRQGHKKGQDVPLAELTSGDCFGEEALVSDASRNATITMLTDGHLLRLSKDNFLELLKKPMVHSVDYDRACAMVDDGGTWLDVRLKDEYANYALKESINIPLAELRGRATELTSNTRYIICCDTGRRSAAAAFLLSQRGFEVFVLENGLRWDIPLGDLAVSGKSPPDTASPAPPEHHSTRNGVPVGQMDWHAGYPSVSAADAGHPATLHNAVVRLQQEMAQYAEKAAQLEVAVSEARSARSALQAELERLAAQIREQDPAN